MIYVVDKVASSRSSSLLEQFNEVSFCVEDYYSNGIPCCKNSTVLEDNCTCNLHM